MRRQRKTSVGVDAHIDPAECNRKIARIFGDPAQHPVGADASVRPLGNCKFATTYHKNGHAVCGSMWATTPTNVVRFRIGAFVFAGAPCRADRVVRPYGCVPFCIGACRFSALCRAGGASPSPTLRLNNTSSLFTITSYLNLPLPYVTTKRVTAPKNRGPPVWEVRDHFILLTAPRRGGRRRGAGRIAAAWRESASAACGAR